MPDLWQWNPEFIARLKETEGFRPRYWDFKQWSIGHGTKWRPGMPLALTREQADAELLRELDEARSHVQARFPRLSPQATEALSSFTYNLGPGWMRGSGLADALDQGDVSRAQRIMLEYVHAGGKPLEGLRSRRTWEANYLGGAPLTSTASAAPVTSEGTGAPIMPGATNVPMNDPRLMSHAALLQIGSDRSRLTAEQLNRIAYQENLPKSALEGIGRTVAAIAGGYFENKADKDTAGQRQALIDLLGGAQNLLPEERFAIASMNPTLQAAVLGKRLESVYRKPNEQETRVAELVRLGIPEAQARAIAYGAIKVDQQGNVIDFRNGTVQTPQGGASSIPGPAAGVGAGVGAGAGAGVGGPAGASAAAVAPAGIRARPEVVTASQKKQSDIQATERTLDAAFDVFKMDPSVLTSMRQAGSAIDRFANKTFGLNTNLGNQGQDTALTFLIKQAFNDYRRYVTGAAAAQKELEQLEQSYINANMGPRDFFIATELLREMGRANYEAYSRLQQEGFMPPEAGDPRAAEYERRFMATRPKIDAEGALKRGEESYKTWQSSAKDKAQPNAAGSAQSAVPGAPSAAPSVVPSISDLPENLQAALRAGKAIKDENGKEWRLGPDGRLH